ncbi:MAG: hypothetical protein JWQ90_3028 [Hydrocarboniphaga sp.]|uniref:hypothetical protein n=1 Tax=Hydrocarboniphaga sp. TaxID=2033016 RepID=UPI0026080409|nr:hypothetical protein [Hydrocarboniphaga sp.]MDB5970578.1 hypothetical protein [Hydrocarboniphaga sp.]
MSLNKRLVVVAAVTAIFSSMGASAGPNDSAGPVPADVAAGSLTGTSGLSLCTAAINSDGTLAGKFRAKSSALVAPGSYEVLFGDICGNITAVNGWSRWVQVDTLTTSQVSGGITCTTADRAGAKNGVFIYCTDAAGAAINTSFFLFVAR